MAVALSLERRIVPVPLSSAVWNETFEPRYSQVCRRNENIACTFWLDSAGLQGCMAASPNAANPLVADLAATCRGDILTFNGRSLTKFVFPTTYSQLKPILKFQPDIFAIQTTERHWLIAQAPEITLL